MKNKIHEIEVCRTGIGFATIKIETDIPITLEQAEKMALDKAGDHLYSEKSSQYDLVNGNGLTLIRYSSPGASSMSIYRDTDLLVDSIVEFFTSGGKRAGKKSIAKCIQDKDTIIERDDLYVELEYHATIFG